MKTQQEAMKAMRQADKFDVESPYREFADLMGIKIETTKAHSNPNMIEAAQDMDHWSVRLYIGYNPGCGIAPKQHFDFFFSKGSGHCGVKPRTAEVLESLALESTTLDFNDFEEWAEDYGYDTDSRKAERSYRVCVEQAERLRVFLGSSAFEELQNVGSWGKDEHGDYYRLEEARREFRSEFLPQVVEQYGQDDEPAISEAWNNWTDFLCKDGEITEWQYHNWPGFDE